MIKLFRNIRKKLAAENKFMAYSRYAIGEIVLVVIGILIALQINNWNEQQKHYKSRTNYTKSLISDLEKDSIQLIEENIKLNARLENLQRIKQRLLSPLATMDTLNHIIKHEHEPSFIQNLPINRNTFSILTSTGNLDFFDQKTAENIQNYYQAATLTENFHAAQLDFYKNLFVQYLTNVPLPSRPESNPFDIIEQENLEQELWQETDIKRVHSIYRGQTSMQLNMFTTFKNSNNGLLALNHRLISQLNNRLK